MVLTAPGQPLVLAERLVPRPGPGEILLRVHACGVCRTDLHIVDGELTEPVLPLVPGHEIVGVVVACGAGVTRFATGDRVGVPWLGSTCGTCPYCGGGRENLCDAPIFTGYTRDGGYAEHAVADARYCFALPPSLDDVHAAPLLCAGLIGYRALRLAGDARRLGIYGFGAAAHVIAQVALWQGRAVYAFTRPGDLGGQAFARSLGCGWAGDSTQPPPEPLDAALIFAPVGALVPAALQATRKGGTVVCAGIHMSDIPTFPYRWLWGERSICSVANLTRADGEEFLALAAQVPVRTTVEVFPLGKANAALDALRAGRVNGAAVLDCR
ncbi:MAG TPA: zinc-dependent alcohol dehydrogenase family protein [Burkholderiaceae bacterium]|nr:zinc-dependent alcohol dehydrogenase family protein [Burkholderiaceae bacterium]HQR76049.1 zinc-dependent alcohol dehydrogenase family protein [Burkholderiaceae bacterium]